MRNVYLLVTDLHTDVDKANRLNYFGEILNAMQDIISIASKYRIAGTSVNLILLGDVFDAGSTRSEDAMQLMEVFYYFTSVFDKVWSVVGNHEITFASNNPFWFLVSDMKDASLSRIKRFIQPRGLTGRIIIPDKIVDGDTVLYFNHYGTEPKEPREGVTRIGLFHQNVGSNDICKMWGTFDNVEEAAYIQGYNYSFFGHMHLAKGEYWLNEAHTCKGEWLGTIGRTKVDEILDDSLEVNVPAIIVDNGRFVSIERNNIHLLSYRDTVDVPRLEASKRSREQAMQRRDVAVANYHGETLYDTLAVSFADSSAGFMLSFLDKSWDEVYHEYQQTLVQLPNIKEEVGEQDGAGHGRTDYSTEQVEDGL